MERNTMKIRTRMLALVLVLSFLLGLCGCLPVPTVRKGETAPEEELQTSEAGLPAREEAIETLAADGYFTPLAREALSFDEMVLGEISLDEFTPYAQALTRAAEAESREAFHRACVEAERMLVRINTAGALLEIESDRDAADEARSTRADNQVQAYYDAMDLYDRTLCEIASGDHAGMLDKEFAAWQIEYFRGYDAESSAQSLYLTNQEAQLVSQYALCSSQDEVDYERLTEIYLQLVSVRAEMAELAGAANYSEYAYSAFYSRDYTPSDAQKIWKTAKEDFAPLLQKYTDSLTQALWKEDLSAGECTEESIVQALCYGAARMSPEIREAAEYLLDHQLYDISYDRKKLSTGYTTYLYSFDAPFIFNCPDGSYTDYTDMFHEFGHWAAGYYHGSDPLYGVPDYDLSELQSQGMEVMFLQFYDDLFGTSAQVLRGETLLNLVYSVVTGAMYDEFQQRVYLEPELSEERLLDIFREVYESYGFEIYDGYEYEWADVIHNFQQPLYYISYAVSAIPALELYVQSVESPNEAMDTYLRVAGMSDEEYYLTDALRETGLSNSMKSPIGDVIAQELEKSGAFDFENGSKEMRNTE